jgi:hypothetical protein
MALLDMNLLVGFQNGINDTNERGELRRYRLALAAYNPAVLHIGTSS